MKLSKEKYIGLGNVPIGIGAIIKGWNIKEDDFRDSSTLPVVDFRAMTNACYHNCFHCFTDKAKKTLTLEEIKGVIDQLAERKTRAIDFLGEGEPTLDKNFFEIIDYTVSRGIHPIIFTDAATKMRDLDFVRKVKKTGASVAPKCDSLWNSEYQNEIVGDKNNKYFDQRNEALQLLMQEGFNETKSDGTTRLGFDMVISKRNMYEVERTLRYCRDNNLWVVFSHFLPSGRSGRESFDKEIVLSEKEKQDLGETVKRIDKEEYGYDHPIYSNFATMPCVEFMQIYGDGRVSPCPGNETVVGNIREHTIRELEGKILKEFPCHNSEKFGGHCLYRPRS